MLSYRFCVALLLLVAAAAAVAQPAGPSDDGTGDFCNAYTSSISCGTHSTSCAWNYFLQLCTGNCWLPYANETVCLQNPSCQWGEGSCYLRCELVKEEACQQSATCEYNGTNCIWGYCSQTSPCSDYSACRWDNAGKCVPSCRSYPGPRECPPGICHWDRDSLTCVETATPAPPTTPAPRTPQPPPPPPGSCPDSCINGCTTTCPYCLHYPNKGMRCYPSNVYEALMQDKDYVAQYGHLVRKLA